MFVTVINDIPWAIDVDLYALLRNSQAFASVVRKQLCLLLRLDKFICFRRYTLCTGVLSTLFVIFINALLPIGIKCCITPDRRYCII